MQQRSAAFGVCDRPVSGRGARELLPVSMQNNSERSKSSPGDMRRPGDRSPSSRTAVAKVLQASANRRAHNAQMLAQQTPAVSTAQELGITPAVTAADALDGGIDFAGTAAVRGSTLQGRDVARTAIRDLSGTPISADRVVQQVSSDTSAGSSATSVAELSAGANEAAAEPSGSTVVAAGAPSAATFIAQPHDAEMQAASACGL